MQPRACPPRHDVDNRERQRQEDIRKALVVSSAHAPADTANDSCSNNAQSHPELGADMPVTDRPPEKRPNAHQDREHSQRQCAIAPDQVFEAGLAGEGRPPVARGRTGRSVDA